MALYAMSVATILTGESLSLQMSVQGTNGLERAFSRHLKEILPGLPDEVCMTIT